MHFNLDATIENVNALVKGVCSGQWEGGGEGGGGWGAGAGAKNRRSEVTKVNLTPTFSQYKSDKIQPNRVNRVVFKRP